MISRSVAQIATASMRTRTSARLGTGTGFSLNFSSPGLPRTHAFILSGIGKSGLVFTPGPEYIRVFPIPFAALLSARGLLIKNFGAAENHRLGRIAGRVTVQIGEHVTILQHHLI